MQQPAQEPEPPPAAWRLTFEYEGDDVRLVDRQQVRMRAPVDDADLLASGSDGYWLELRDAGGAPLYSQVLHQPLQTHYEVFSPEPGARPRLVPAPEVRGAFQVVVPDLPDGEQVALQGPPPPAAPPGAADEVAVRSAGPRTLLAAPLREEAGRGDR